VNAFKFAIFNDIHLDLGYSGVCKFMMCNDLGSYSSDASVALFSTILDDVYSSYDEDGSGIDAIIISGDFNSHGTSVDYKGDNT
jgi:hypothetical protein